MRRTREQAKETRHAILQAACELFTEGDFSQITLNQIAERAGLTKGAIYWHFKNKNDILLRIIKELCRIDEREFFEALVMPDSAEDLSTLYKKVLVRPDSDIRYRIGHKLQMCIRDSCKCHDGVVECRVDMRDTIADVLFLFALTAALYAFGQLLFPPWLHLTWWLSSCPRPSSSDLCVYGRSSLSSGL